MSYSPPITIFSALDKINKHEYVLPAIQREFVWNESQICHLFDSLMLGYPIGSFLFWRVERKNVKEYTFYDFIRNYHEHTGRHCPQIKLSGTDPVVAILDGQQRLSSLNIGLQGSHAVKLPRMRWNNSHAYPIRRLHLNICSKAPDNDLKMAYDFRFLTDEQAKKAEPGQHWFPVPLIMDLDPHVGIFNYVKKHELVETEAFHILGLLHRRVHTDLIISSYDEASQDLDKVLNIFIRVNSGGTKLSYSDLLLSIATAQWDDIDAREEIHRLVDELNQTRYGFRFSKDVVLKAGLLLSDLPSIGFKVTNFNQGNMQTLADHWSRIVSALRLSSQLLAKFGFSSETLSADSVLLPIAYYVFHRDLSESYLNAKAHEKDREKVRRWVIKSLLKPGGIWGSGLDTLLLALRAAIQEHGATEFPQDAIEVAMAKRGKSLRFDFQEVEELLEVKYGDKRVFPMLSLLYDGVGLDSEFHIDHIFPRAKASPSRLKAAGLDGKAAEELREKIDRLPNLQLLEGPVNNQKRAKLPADWLNERFPTDVDRAAYAASHDFPVIPASLSDFELFYQTRYDRLKVKLMSLLGLELEATQA